MVMSQELAAERIFADRMREPDAAAYIGVAPKTLANWRSAGKGPRFCRLGRVIVYQKNDLDQYFEDHMQATVEVG